MVRNFPDGKPRVGQLVGGNSQTPFVKKMGRSAAVAESEQFKQMLARDAGAGGHVRQGQSPPEFMLDKLLGPLQGFDFPAWRRRFWLVACREQNRSTAPGQGSSGMSFPKTGRFGSQKMWPCPKPAATRCENQPEPARRTTAAAVATFAEPRWRQWNTNCGASRGHAKTGNARDGRDSTEWRGGPRPGSVGRPTANPVRPFAGRPAGSRAGCAGRRRLLAYKPLLQKPPPPGASAASPEICFC